MTTEQLVLQMQLPPRKTVYTVYSNQRRLVRDLLALHELPTIDADLCYGAGALYPDVVVPRIRLDLKRPPAGGICADCQHIPLASGSLHSILLDPPWLTHSSDNGIMDARYGHVRSIRECWRLYELAIKDAARVLHRGGKLVVKCQDAATRDGNRFTHVKVYQYAIAAGLRPVDIFILTGNRPLAVNIPKQRFARKAHCYFWIFRKPYNKGPLPAGGYLV